MCQVTHYRGVCVWSRTAGACFGNTSISPDLHSDSVGLWLGDNEPLEGVLIDSVSQTCCSLTPSPRAARLCPPLGSDGQRIEQVVVERPKLRPGSRWKGSVGGWLHLSDSNPDAFLGLSWCGVWMVFVLHMKFWTKVTSLFLPIFSQYSECHAEVPGGKGRTGLWQNLQPEDWWVFSMLYVAFSQFCIAKRSEILNVIISALENVRLQTE